MEKEKNKKLKIILIGVSIGLVISIAGILVYKFYPRSDEVRKNGTVTKQLEIKHTNEDAKTNINDKVVLDEEDVKKWLDNHELIEWKCILEEKDFDINKTSFKEYGEFIFEYLIYKRENIVIESKTLGEDSISKYGEYYSNEYVYNLSSVKDMLNDYFGVGIDKMNVNVMNETYNGYANMLIENDKIYLRVKTYDGYNNKYSELNKIYLNNDNNIVVNYTLKECIAVEEKAGCKIINHREIVLKKTNTGYNLLKAYKVEN